MIDKAIKRVESAARAAARNGMTTGLREYATYMGWSPQVAQTLRVDYVSGAFVVTSDAESALDSEYGDSSGSSPKPAIRTYDSKGLAKARLREELDKVAEAVL